MRIYQEIMTEVRHEKTYFAICKERNIKSDYALKSRSIVSFMAFMLHQSFGWGFKSRPRLCMTIGVGGTLKTDTQQEFT